MQPADTDAYGLLDPPPGYWKTGASGWGEGD